MIIREYLKIKNGHDGVVHPKSYSEIKCLDVFFG